MARRPPTAAASREARLATLGTVLAGVAHELGGHLAIAGASIQLAAADADLDPSTAELIDRASRAVATASETLNTVTLLAQRPGTADAEHATINIDSIAESLRQVGGDRVIVDIDHRLTELAPRGGGALRQIAINLAANALRYAPKASAVRVRLERLDEHQAARRLATFSPTRPSKRATWHIAATRTTLTSWDGPWIAMHVSDHGVGISSSVLRELFSPTAARLRPLAHAKTRSGYGLVLCRALTELANGVFVLCSHDTIGTHALVLVPAIRVRLNKMRVAA